MSNASRTPWLIRLALVAFPRAFRDAHAAEMEDDYVEARSACETKAARAWLALRTAANVAASGFSERRAAAARSKVQRPPQSCGRDKASFAAVHDLLRDVRYATRGLARRPGFTLIAVTTLALGIGANTAIFSVVNAVLLRSLEWEEADRLVRVWRHGDDDPELRGTFSLPDLLDVAELPAVDAAVGFGPMTATVLSDGEPALVDAARTTSSLMEVFRVRPFMGRDITAADNEMGRPPVVVVSYRYWRERLGGHADILGTTLEISEVSYEIVGVAPARFDFPDGAQLWVPRWNPPGCARGCHTLRLVARLAGDATPAALDAQLRALATRLEHAYPDTNFGKRFRAVRIADDQVADVRRGLWFILGAVSLVLLIACANVANLMLVRGEDRRGEVALRSALGASRARLARHVLIESMILTVAGAAAGLALARAAVTVIRAMPAETVPRIETVMLDANVLVFTLALSAAVVLLFGMGPALRQARRPAARGLIADRRRTGDVRASRSRAVLLAAEVAFSVLLLAGTALMLKSFDRLYSVELGFSTERLARFRVALPYSRYDSLAKVVTFYETLEERLAALPGVVTVASALGPPLAAGSISGPVHVEGRPPAEPSAETTAWVHSITPSYFETMRLPLLRGRGIEPGDRTETLPVAVVSRTFVDENFPNEDPIGKRFNVDADFGYGTHAWTIVGVAGDVLGDLTATPEADLYVPLGQFGPNALTVTLRTATGPTPPVGAVRGVLHALDPRLPVIGYETVDDVLRTSVAPTRFYLLAMGTFAGLAVGLACVGLYGVVAYTVSQRGREIGIRMALGAQRDQVVRMVLIQALRPAIVGITVGTGLTLASGRVIESLLFEVSARDPAILAAVVGVLAAVAFAATLLPARRASRVDPTVALRDP